LVPIGKDKFYYIGNYAEVTFRRGDDGKVKELGMERRVGQSSLDATSTATEQKLR
jgi:hypothetical protein